MRLASNHWLVFLSVTQKNLDACWIAKLNKKGMLQSSHSLPNAFLVTNACHSIQRIWNAMLLKHQGKKTSQLLTRLKVLGGLLKVVTLIMTTFHAKLIDTNKMTKVDGLTMLLGSIHGQNLQKWSEQSHLLRLEILENIFILTLNLTKLNLGLLSANLIQILCWWCGVVQILRWNMQVEFSCLNTKNLTKHLKMF